MLMLMVLEMAHTVVMVRCLHAYTVRTHVVSIMLMLYTLHHRLQPQGKYVFMNIHSLYTNNKALNSLLTWPLCFCSADCRYCALSGAPFSDPE